MGTSRSSIKTNAKSCICDRITHFYGLGSQVPGKQLYMTGLEGPGTQQAECESAVCSCGYEG